LSDARSSMRLTMPETHSGTTSKAFSLIFK
jgi:hypothetical protein